MDWLVAIVGAGVAISAFVTVGGAAAVFKGEAMDADMIGFLWFSSGAAMFEGIAMAAGGTTVRPRRRRQGSGGGDPLIGTFGITVGVIAAFSAVLAVSALVGA